jgi:hypothetical protein
LEALINRTVRLVGRVGGALPGRKVLTLVHTIVAGGSHIDHADMLRAGATQRVLGFRVMAPSTLGRFLRAFTFGHIRQLDAVIAETIRRAWDLSAGPGAERLVVDGDSTITEVVASTSRAPATAKRNGSATTQSSRRGRRPAKCSTLGCAKVPPTRSAS